ncbi:hypothetical protein SEA_WOLLYPOG_78 [Arthrobacter phage Wollypog]|uniref:Uncharacterized protein n=1 Tax=Arthrobacter phage Wollypog TaxID=2790985 RepID=A0A7T3N1G1_9CAUD|nr:hypothetical protein PP291_gp78 [Arthrobacter phage Wollypog]QPX62627.1 hypothetical protein SEA_WOLLYPOG_78 [Arthrobacter phage Wollypog]
MAMKTCDGQIMDWWSEKCTTETCGHLLAAHKDVSVGTEADPGLVLMNGECTFCVMEKQNAENLSLAKQELQQFASNLMEEAKAFANDLQAAAKEYIDSENQKFAKVAKDYVDGQVVNTIKPYVDGEVGKVRTDSKSYIDSEVGKVPTWTNNRLVQVVKPEALKVDPRTAP